MSPVFRLLLSILSLLLIIWVISLAYTFGFNELQDVSKLNLAFILTIFLVLTAAYFITDAIQKIADSIRKKTTDTHKIQLYESILHICQIYLLTTDEIEQEQYERKLNELILNASLHANVGILRTLKRIQLARKHGNSTDEKKEALRNLILAMRADLGNSNFNINKELQAIIS